MGSNAKIGRSFETIFERLVQSQRIAITRIPDGCRRVGKVSLIQMPTPWDWVLSYNGKTALIDTKTTLGTFPHSKITDHQIKAMIEHVVHGAKAGYVIWFRQTDHIVFIAASLLLQCSLTRGSVNFQTPGCKILGNNLMNTDLRKLFE